MRLRLHNSVAEAHGTKYLFIKDLHFNHGHESLLEALQQKTALTYRFKEDEKGFTIFVSFARKKPSITTKKELGAIGVDVNVDHLAVVETDRNGNPIHKKRIPLCTYGKNKDQARALIGDACKEVAYLAKQVNKHIVVEKLDFKKKKITLKENSSSKNSRMLSSFSYNLIVENLERKAFSRRDRLSLCILCFYFDNRKIQVC